MQPNGLTTTWRLLLVALIPTWGCVHVTSDDDSASGDDDSAVTDDDDDDGADDDVIGDDDTAAHPAFALLTLNLHCFKTEGTNFGSNAERFAAIAELAAAEGVAAMALQEVCQREGESALAMLIEALESATGEDWSSAWAFAHVAWEGTEDEADEGVAIAVRGALTDEGALTYHAQSALQRVGLAADLPAELGGYRLHSLHLDYEDPDVRALQARQAATAGIGERQTLGVLVAGDLNDTAGSATHQSFADMGFVDLSAGLDPTRIDHAMAHRGAGIELLSAELVFDGGETPSVSDHPGVLVQLDHTASPLIEITRITANVDVGWGHFLSVRGDTAPLSWDLGWHAYPAADDQWVLLLTELPQGPFQYKVLIDDVTWQAGDNVTGEAGEDNETTPTFE